MLLDLFGKRQRRRGDPPCALTCRRDSRVHGALSAPEPSPHRPPHAAPRQACCCPLLPAAMILRLSCVALWRPPSKRKQRSSLAVWHG
jgi:hypothetical protein